ncbi:TonB-dependent siderophore receptor [Microbulbifer rhizosphaerae]|uniref:Iron complex outermembrane receptor protein n=1 Tax=Microbulbifer rhizosphaerae TaxID=1562603 RepID=A0A7W4ZC21_9GAMM|nr:TonB-dependent receptor [Microbulbifer rhizosphaerae]MBB3062890.1 iron complex outermembrane receptor protein [Microbulbifer rhizosphaerae]
MKPTQPKHNLLKHSLLSLAVAAGTAWAQEGAETEVELDTYIAEEEVQDDLGLLPTEPVESVFGFGKTILETPRAVSSISADMIEAFNISDIDDLVVVSPGAFTQSFFGVAGALDVRGTAGEVYFRGMRRLDNPGNYPTPLAASDRIDIVRGPATPIMGTAKIGGYLNFVPKSARAETGQYLDSATGAISARTGSWDKKIVSAEMGGPMQLGDRALGYYVYAETEDSGSYYDNSETQQDVLQASFNLDLSDKSRIEFGGMYHDYDGNQVAGWNRLTQALVDDGTYVTGDAQPLDVDGDGTISHQEYDACACSNFVSLAGDPSGSISTDVGLVPETVGTTKLDGNQVLVAEDDLLQNEALTLYFDYIYTTDSGWTLSNKIFYDAYDNLNENAYGFSQFHDSYVIEEKFIAEYAFESSAVSGSLQLSPSIRHTDFEHGDDFFNEFFDRRDLTKPSSSLDARLLATRIDRDYSEYYVGEYTDYGFGVMADLNFAHGFSAILGARYDSIEMESTTPAGKTRFGGDEDVSASDTENGVSWTTSLSWDSGFGITPYITASKQLTVIAGQGADITVDNIADGTAVDDSNLQELGIKGSFLDGRLFMALAHFKQDRTSFNAQSATTNESVETKGTELELRYVVTDALTLTAAATDIEIVNLNTQENGGRFTFLGAEDLAEWGIGPEDIAGGAVIGVVSGPAEKAGVPEQSYSFTAHYKLFDYYTVSASYFHADETPSGFTNAVMLPAYDLVNLGFGFKKDAWSADLALKNVTDEEYHRSNFPNLFGSSVVLPERPFNWELSMAYSF